MGRYRVVSFPVDGLWECTACAALVSDRQLHDSSVHGEWGGTPDVHSLPPAQVPVRDYEGQPAPRGEYRQVED